ncbi:MAG: asparagine synthase (glutamine-hydrolyzing) [Candidatus Omnitrophica bacterium]|nr:asparagine synthase (glutamine-hydrolyzing) [Candidatus Omnitrophota bacterium]
MSAISGVVSAGLIDQAQPIIKKMCDIQAHRGPHGEGIFQQKQVCFGHRLLNTSKSTNNTKEPITSEDKSIVIVFDGSIYNSEEIRHGLEKKGYIFASQTDSELVLRSYEAFEMGCLASFNGDFAFAVWDNRKGKTFLARDRFGIKPLFYSVNDKGILIFASELKAIIKSGLIGKKIDYGAIYHYLFFTFFHQPQTPLKNIESVVPGHYVVFDPNTSALKSVKYWEVPFSEEKSFDEEYLVNKFDEILNESIRSRIKKDESLAVSLSGGIDSSFIAKKITSAGHSLKTYTLGFKGEGEEYNEFKFARDVANDIGAMHHECILESREILKNHAKMIWHLETPTSGIILPYFIAKTVGEDKIDVIFRGDGAHSIFESPEERKFAVIQRAFQLMNIMPEPFRKNLCDQIEKQLNKFAPYYRNRNNNFAWITHILSRYFKAVTGKRNMELLFTEAERKELFLEPFWENDSYFKETSEIVLEIMNKIITNDIREKMIYEEYYRFPNQALMYITNVHAGFSLECRQPYWDHKLVEFSQNNLPLSLRNKNHQDKYIFKQICRSNLSNKIIDRAQHGFYMPIHRWLRNELRPLVDDVFSEETVKKRGLFKYGSMRSIYEQYYNSPRGMIAWRKIWCLVALETWFRLFFDPGEIESP